MREEEEEGLREEDYQLITLEQAKELLRKERYSNHMASHKPPALQIKFCEGKACKGCDNAACPLKVWPKKAAEWLRMLIKDSTMLACGCRIANFNKYPWLGKIDLDLQPAYKILFEKLEKTKIFLGLCDSKKHPNVLRKPFFEGYSEDQMESHRYRVLHFGEESEKEIYQKQIEFDNMISQYNKYLLAVTREHRSLFKKRFSLVVEEQGACSKDNAYD